MTERIPAALLARRTAQTIVAGWRDPAMQRVSDALRSGLSWYAQGELPLTEGARLAAKFQAAFPQLTRDRRHAHRQKLAGAPRYRLIMFANRPSAHALFWLMTDQPIDPRERWLDASNGGLLCYDWEAVRRTRVGSSSPAWTWAMTAEAFALAKEEIRDAIRLGRADQAIAFGGESRTWPGYAGVRAQRTALARVYVAEWRRKFRDEPPAWPRLSYVQRLRTR